MKNYEYIIKIDTWKQLGLAFIERESSGLPEKVETYIKVFSDMDPQTSQTLCKYLDESARIPGKGFLQGSCHVLITVFSLQNVSSDCTLGEGLYLSSALRLSSQITLANRETSVSLCVTLETRASKQQDGGAQEWRGKVRRGKFRWGCNVRMAPKSPTISTFPWPGVFEQKNITECRWTRSGRA